MVPTYSLSVTPTHGQFELLGDSGLISGWQGGSRQSSGSDVGLAHHTGRLAALTVMDAPAIMAALSQILLGAHTEQVIQPVPVCERQRFTGFDCLEAKAYLDIL